MTDLVVVFVTGGTRSCVRRVSPGDLLLGHHQRGLPAQEPDPHAQGPDRAAAYLEECLHTVASFL